MLASLMFTLLSLLGVIPAGITGLSVVYVFAEVSFFWCSDTSSLYILWHPVWSSGIFFTQLAKRFPALYRTQWFITTFTRAHHLSLSWARFSHPVSLRSSLISSHWRLEERKNRWWGSWAMRTGRNVHTLFWKCIQHRHIWKRACHSYRPTHRTCRP